MSDIESEDIKLLQHALARPAIYVGSASATAILAFFAGYGAARDELNQPSKIWEAIFKKTKLMLYPESTSLSLQMILLRLANNDEVQALELLRDTVNKVLAQEKGAGTLPQSDKRK